jgi:Homeodomain-like domain
MLRLVAQGLSDLTISKMYGCTSPTVARWRDRYGIPRSQAKPHGDRELPAYYGFFSQIDTPEKAYILGFLIADGHISKSGTNIELGVKESDVGILEAIVEAIGCTVSIRTMINSYDRSHFKRISLWGRPIVSDLGDLGLHHDKSTTATFPSVPAELEGHLVRGIWDGDGWIGKYQFELIGTSALLDGVVAAAERHTGCQLRRRMSGKDGRYHYAYGTRRDTAILHWMYSGAGIALKRKQEKFLTYWSEVPSAESLNLRLGPRVYTRKNQGRSAADYPSAG